MDTDEEDSLDPLPVTATMLTLLVVLWATPSVCIIVAQFSARVLSAFTILEVQG